MREYIFSASLTSQPTASSLETEIKCDVSVLWYVRVPMAQWGKNPPVMQETGDAGPIPWSGRFPEEGHGNPLQYSCLENPMDREAWKATVHGVIRVGHD